VVGTARCAVRSSQRDDPTPAVAAVFFAMRQVCVEKSAASIPGLMGGWCPYQKQDMFRTELQWSARELTSMMNKLPSSVTELVWSAMELPSWMNELPSLVMELPSWMSKLVWKMIKLPSLTGKLTSSITELVWKLTELPSCITQFIGSALELVLVHRMAPAVTYIFHKMRDVCRGKKVGIAYACFSLRTS
jgi:hypothetical protein